LFTIICYNLEVRYIPSVILIIESILSFYKYFSPRSYFGPNVADLIFGLVFVILAFVMNRKSNSRVLQWLVVFISLLFGPGGPIGFGGLLALVLAASFILLSKNLSKPVK